MSRLAPELMLKSFVADAVALIATSVAPIENDDLPDAGPRAVPRDLRLWLARLRLLAGVPFGHLVADPALLPPESIRFFYVDRDWTDALVQGALSVGTITTNDRVALGQLHRTVRGEVDEAERLVRLPGVEPGAAVPTGPAGALTGFLLRSRMVSGWPGLHVRAYREDNLAQHVVIADDRVGEADNATLGRIGVLRFERLAPAVLLVLFDGVPSVVHIEEPRAGIQFGVEEQGVTLSGTVRVKLGRARSFDIPAGTTLRDPISRVEFRSTVAVHTEDATADVKVE